MNILILPSSRSSQKIMQGLRNESENSQPLTQITRVKKNYHTAKHLALNYKVPNSAKFFPIQVSKLHATSYNNTPMIKYFANFQRGYQKFKVQGKESWNLFHSTLFFWQGAKKFRKSLGLDFIFFACLNLRFVCFPQVEVHPIVKNDFF